MLIELTYTPAAKGSQVQHTLYHHAKKYSMGEHIYIARTD